MKKNKVILYTPMGNRHETTSPNTPEGRAEFKWFLQKCLELYLSDVKAKAPEWADEPKAIHQHGGPTNE